METFITGRLLLDLFPGRSNRLGSHQVSEEFDRSICARCSNTGSSSELLLEKYGRRLVD